MKCRFCNIINREYTFNEIDEPILENEDFFSITSIGSIIEGWLLVIPKKHDISMRNYYETNELKSFINKILPIMQKQYGRVIAFEHGTNAIGSPTGCGTDHAHLHLVAFPDSLEAKLLNSNLIWVKCLSSNIKELVGDKEYLFYTDIGREEWDNPTGYLTILEYPVSQFFRKLLADYYGKLDMSDYKNYPFIDNALNTKKSFSEISA